MNRWKKCALVLALALLIVPAARAEAGVYQFSESDVGDSPFSQEEEAQEKQNELIPTATLSPQAAQLPWNLMLVNRNNPVPADWEVELVTLDNGRQVDARMFEELQAMFEDCRKAGLLPMVNTAYRTEEDQKKMLVSKYKQYRNMGYKHKAAQAAALKLASYPGYSEHQLGLAVDIDSANKKVCSNEDVWYWVKRHCHEYGFIWRYPSVKTDITGISNEDWHFRYVGVEAATYIMENRMCLEEYLQEFYGIPY